MGTRRLHMIAPKIMFSFTQMDKLDLCHALGIRFLEGSRRTVEAVLAQPARAEYRPPQIDEAMERLGDAAAGGILSSFSPR